MKILALSPHPDDIELTAGATLAKWNIHNIRVITFAFPEMEGLRAEQKKALNILGIDKINDCTFKNRELSRYRQSILDLLIKMKDTFKPDLVLCPNPFDVHQDHKVIYEETERAFKDCSILGYDSNWNNYRSENRFFVPVSQMEVNLKLEALKSYESQIKLKRQYFNEDYQLGNLVTNGAKIKEHFAECFSVIRWIYK